MLRLIDLAPNRTLTVHEGGRRYSVTIPPIPESVWFESYFDAVTTRIKCGPAGVEKQIDVNSAVVGLVERMAISCEGYPHLMGVADWQSKIPLTHRTQYGLALVQTRELIGGAPMAPAGARGISIEAVWSGSAIGEMLCHRNLVHYFKTPSAKQKERFQRARSDVRRTNDFTRRGAPVFFSPTQPFVAHALAALYDELILKVEGYAINGEPLTNDREKIIGHMDTHHKVTAARPLFCRRIAQTEGRRVA